MADYDELIARAERAIRDAQDFTDDKKPSLALTLELLAAVKDGPKRKLRITGPNSDGEYWLHMDGNGRRGGINLGASHGPIVDSLLEAFSETPAAREAGQAAQPVAHVDGRSYRKKPVVVKAVQWTGENLREVIAFMDGPPETKSHHAGMMWEQYEDLVRKNGLKIYTLEGKMDASPGDWIIKGVKGEFYPCKPDIFAATYDPANQPTAPVVPAEGLDSERLVAAWLAETEGFASRQERLMDDILAECDLAPWLHAACQVGIDAALRAHQPAAPVSGVTVREAGWRPIETAPHEELVVLGWQENGVWKQEIALASAGERFPNGYSNMWAHGCATHWMPLPEPPAALLPAGEGEE